MAGTSPAMTKNNDPVIPGLAKRAPESITTIVSMDSGPAPSSASTMCNCTSGNDQNKNGGNHHVHHHARAETDRSVHVVACGSAGAGEESWAAHGAAHHRGRRRAAHHRRRGS